MGVRIKAYLKPPPQPSSLAFHMFLMSISRAARFFVFGQGTASSIADLALAKLTFLSWPQLGDKS